MSSTGKAATETAYAKINLALHLRRRRDDGYHEIETIFAFAEDGDTLTAEPAAAITLTIDGPLAADLACDDDNLVLRAARLLAGASGRGAHLHLTKRLPIAAGLGGGSADAAAALRLLSALWDVPVPEGLAAALGADVAACLLSRTSHAEGLGYPVTEIAAGEITGTPLLLVNPRLPLSTAAVYRGWDGVDRGPLPAGLPLGVALAGRNDLEAPALALQPVVADVLALLGTGEGLQLARMSGSGATCFALYADDAARDAAAARIARAQPGWWQLATRLR
jgi:4-diphosphocytidyl-2-C-methyl-D-erythritol kinase